MLISTRLPFLAALLIFSTAAHSIFKTCHTENCLKQSEEIKSRLNMSVDPCDDFYEFSCGNFKPSTDYPFTQLAEFLKEDEKLTDPKHVRLAKNFYQSCMSDQGKLEEEMKIRIESSGFPFSESKRVDENFKLMDFIKKFQFYQSRHAVFFLIDFRTEYGNLLISPPAMPSNFGQQTITNLDKNDDKKFEYEFREFWNSLNESLSKKLEEDTNPQNVTISELEILFPMINWIEYLNDLTAKTRKFDKDSIVVVSNMKTIEKIAKLVKETKPHILKNFIILFYIDAVKNLAVDYANFNTPGAEKIGADNDVSKICIQMLNNRLKIASSVIYSQLAIDRNSKNQLNDMISEIKEKFLEELSTTDWLDLETKEKVILKLRKMKLYAGVHGLLDDGGVLEDYYKDLNFDGLNFWEILEALQNFNKKNFVNFLTGKNILYQFEQTTSMSQTSNAFYNLLENEVVVLARDILNFFYSRDHPKSISFGGFGATVGHEMIHGFDNFGHLFDENGKQNKNWFSEKSEKAYGKRAQCIIDQYSNYTEPVTGLKVNGTLTLGDNIADNGGFQLAYRTYQKMIETENEFDFTLPNLPFDSNQLFWIGLGTSWCRVEDDYRGAKDLIENDAHAPVRFRINGVLGNSDDFMRDFRCSEKSKMNRKNKCKLW